MLETKPTDPRATDTADPARIFRLMFPLPSPRIDWRLFSHPSDFLARWGGQIR